MAIDRATFLEIVKDAYSAYYTILPAEEGEEELPLAFRAEYKVRDEQYFFALAEKCMDFSLREMLPKVKPHKQHQYTNCKVILIADSLDEATVAAVRKKHFSKSYGFLSTEGYTELLAAAVDLSTEKTCANRVGRDLEPFFSKLFALRHEETPDNGK